MSGGNPTVLKRRGVVAREALLAACRNAIETATPLPPLLELVVLLGMPSLSSLRIHINKLYHAGELRMLHIGRGHPPVFRLRDGRETPGRPPGLPPRA